MHRAERVLRKQVQTEGNELKTISGNEATVVGKQPEATGPIGAAVGQRVMDKPMKGLWGLGRKESWEKF